MRLSGLVRSQEDIVAAFAGRRILICGASGNLGSHVARQLAPLGVRLSLWGRDARRLQEVADACGFPASQIAWRSVDLSNINAALAALREEDSSAPFDCAFFVSGAGDTREAGRKVESPALVIRLGLLNYVAPAALSAELGERMAVRGAGRIALIGTAAASHPLPFAAGYTSSKCGLAHFADAMRLALKPHGVSITLVSPAFFSAADEGSYAYSRPGEIPANVVAQRLIRAAALGRSELVTPRRFLVLRWIGRMLPRPLRDRLMLSLPSP